jgi:hypothetical protein
MSPTRAVTVIDNCYAKRREKRRPRADLRTLRSCERVNAGPPYPWCGRSLIEEFQGPNRHAPITSTSVHGLISP